MKHGPRAHANAQSQPSISPSATSKSKPSPVKRPAPTYKELLAAHERRKVQVREAVRRHRAHIKEKK